MHAVLNTLCHDVWYVLLLSSLKFLCSECVNVRFGMLLFRHLHGGVFKVILVIETLIRGLKVRILFSSFQPVDTHSRQILAPTEMCTSLSEKRRERFSMVGKFLYCE